MADDLIIKIDGDASGLEKELSNAGSKGVKAFREAGDEGESAMDRVRAAAMKIGAALAASKILKELIDFGKEAVNLASDLQEVQNVVDVTFGEGNTTIEAFAQSAAENFGIAELSAKKMTGTMGAMLKSMGVENIEEMSTGLAGLAGDMASFYNMKPEEAFAKLRSGISGQTEPLKELGINMSVANLEAYAMAQGIETSWQEMDAAQQAAVRYGYIMQSTADAQGDFARTSDSFANQMRLAEMNIESLKTKIGESLLPIVNDVTKGFNDILGKVQEVFPQVQEVISGFVTDAGALFEEWDLGDELTAGIDGAKEQLSGIFADIKETWDTIFNSEEMQNLKNTLGETIGGLLEQAGPLVEWLRAEVDYWLIQIGNFWSLLAPILTGVIAMIDDVAAAFIAMKTMIAKVVNDIWQLFGGLMNLIVGVVTLDKERVVNAFRSIRDSVVNIFKDLGTGIGEIFSRLWNGVKEFFEKAFGGLFDRIGNGIREKLENLLNGIIEKIPGWLKDLVGINADFRFSLKPEVDASEVESAVEEATAGLELNFDDITVEDNVTLEVEDVDTSATDEMEQAFNDLIAGMSQEGENLAAEYTTMQTGVSESTQKMIDEVNTALEQQAFLASPESMEVVNLARYSQGVSQEAIESWTNLNSALALVKETIGGTENEAGLSSVFTEINNMLSSITGLIPVFCDLLTNDIPEAVPAALKVLGQISTGKDGGMVVSGSGNTLYNALGAIKMVLEEINGQLGVFVDYMTDKIPKAVPILQSAVGAAQSACQAAAAAANEAAAAFNAWADAIAAVIGMLEELSATGYGGGSGSGTPTLPGHAHGGQMRGVGIVGERGAEIVSTSRNINVFTNRALQIAQNRVANMLSRESMNSGAGSLTNVHNDNSRVTSVNVGTVLGADWLGNEINRRIRASVERELFYGQA